MYRSSVRRPAFLALSVTLAMVVTFVAMVATGQAHTWRYRGQIRPANKRIEVEAVYDKRDFRAMLASDADRYSGYNLILGELADGPLHYHSNRGPSREIEPGLHGRGLAEIHDRNARRDGVAGRGCAICCMDDAESGGIASTSYWFNTRRLPDVSQVHEYLDSLDETGKVLSVDTALCRHLGSYGVQPDMVMGHSLGEYGALVAAGSLTFEAALEAVQRMAGERRSLAVLGDSQNRSTTLRIAALFAHFEQKETEETETSPQTRRGGPLPSHG